VTLTAPVAAQVADDALDAGFIINAPRPDVLRLAPPLIITAEQLNGFVAVLPELLDRATAAGSIR
jgi:acetylornithine aminotransferase